MDNVDKKILRILQQDGRVTLSELAEKIGLSATAASERFRRLQHDGVVSGFGARIEPAALGLGLLVFVEVHLDKTTPDVFDRFSDAAFATAEILECHMVAGGFDYLIKARLPDMRRYREFLGNVLLGLPGVRETRTYAVIEEVKREGFLPI